MSHVKSAFEIAMERAQDIETDPEQERRQELMQHGKRLAGSFLFDIDTTFEQTKSQYEEFPEKDLPFVKEGIKEVVTANISLPQTETYVEDLGRLKQLAQLFSGTSQEINDLFVQVDNLYTQYLQNREQLEQRVFEQYRPKFEQKKRMMAQQSGQADFQPEQDKEFVDMLQQNYKHLDEQYQQVLDQYKEQLTSLMD
ncbi:MAG: DUF6657 family protein [Spirochaetota bacterium]